MYRFAVDEVAIIVKACNHFAHFVGKECTIIKRYDGQLTTTDTAYYVEVAGESPSTYNLSCFVAEDYALKKLPPPNELATWEDVQDKIKWSPPKVNHATN